MSKWPENKFLETRNSINMAFAKGAMCIRFIETTALGWNFFKDLWDSAKEFFYESIFSGWFVDERNRERPPPNYVVPPEILHYFHERPEIEKYFRQHDVKERWEDVKYWLMRFVEVTVKREFNDDMASFRQEMPSNPSEAFIGSGSFLVDPNTLLLLRNGVRNPIRKVDIAIRRMMEKEERTATISNITISPNPYGSVSIWEEPDPTKCYALGVDLCSGDSEQDSVDFASIFVIDRSNWQPVAEFHAHSPPEEVAWVAIALSVMYRGFLSPPICWEVNNHGQIASLVFMESGRRFFYGYRLYLRMRPGNQRGKRYDNKYGYDTKELSRDFMLTQLRIKVIALSKTSNFHIRSRELLTELGSMSLLNTKRKLKAMGGKNDDRPFGYGFALRADGDDDRKLDMIRPKTEKEKPKGEMEDIIMKARGSAMSKTRENPSRKRQSPRDIRKLNRGGSR